MITNIIHTIAAASQVVLFLIGLLVVLAALARWLWIRIKPFEPWINEELKDWVKRNCK